MLSLVRFAYGRAGAHTFRTLEQMFLVGSQRIMWQSSYSCTVFSYLQILCECVHILALCILASLPVERAIFSLCGRTEQMEPSTCRFAARVPCAAAVSTRRGQRPKVQVNNRIRMSYESSAQLRICFQLHSQPLGQQRPCSIQAMLPRAGGHASLRGVSCRRQDCLLPPSNLRLQRLRRCKTQRYVHVVTWFRTESSNHSQCLT